MRITIVEPCRTDPRYDVRSLAVGLGPLTVGISVERDAAAGAKSRMVIVGNARFAADQ